MKSQNHQIVTILNSEITYGKSNSQTEFQNGSTNSNQELHRQEAIKILGAHKACSPKKNVFNRQKQKAREASTERTSEARKTEMRS